jgi:hypothetical protein
MNNEIIKPDFYNSIVKRSKNDRQTAYRAINFSMIGNAFRAIRNTHHGYINEKDEKHRFATYISLHTGKIPDNFTAIHQFIWLSVLVNRENTILTDWISDSILQSTLI